MYRTARPRWIIDTFSAVEQDGSILSVMTRRDVTITEGNVDDECEIAWTTIGDKHDLALSYATYDQNDVAAGSTLPITLGVLNKGTDAINTVTITVKNSKGSTVFTETTPLTILPGVEKEMTINVPMGEELTLDTYTVTVENGSNDYNTEDNSYAVKIGYTNLQLTTEVLNIHNTISVMACVENISDVTSGGQLNIYNSLSDEAIQTIMLDELTPGAQDCFYLDITEEMVGGSSGVLRFEVVPFVDQYDTFSGSESVFIQMCEHEHLGEWTTTKEATCTEPGERVRCCSDCGGLVLTSTIPALEHIDNNHDSKCDICGINIVSYRVVYNANGGFNAPQTQEKEKDVVLTLSVDTPTRIGYTFIGWNTKADGSGTSYQPGDTYAVNANLTLYAQWSGTVGDVNNDGSIDLKDVVLLRRSLTGGWDVTVDDAYADVNRDGAVDLKDVVILRRYLAGGWNITL